MIHSKLIRLLSTLTDEECRLFGEFLASPFHQKSQKINNFWALISPWFPAQADNESGREEALDKQRIFQQLFPELEYKDSNISNLMTTMGNLLEEFWIQLSLREIPQLRDRLLLQVYREKEGLEADFERLWKSLERRRKESQNIDPESLFLLLSIKEVYLSFQSEHQPRNASLALEESLEVLNEFTVLLNLKYYLAALNRSRLVGDRADLGLQETIWAFLDKVPDLMDKAPIRTFRYVILCLLEPEISGHFHLARKTFAEDLPSMADHEGKTIAYTLLNAFNGRLKSEGQAVLPELLDLYRTCYENESLFVGEYLDRNVYLNILNVATGVIKQRQGEEQEDLRTWRAEFVTENYLRLHPDHRAETFLYARAYLAYQEAEFATAYQLLSQYKPVDMLADLSRRSLLIRVYYDAWDEDLFDSQVKSALMYISRASAVSDRKREAYNRFVKITRQLSGIRGKKVPEKKIQAIRELIQSPEPLECRQWLEEKVEEEGLEEQGGQGMEV